MKNRGKIIVFKILTKTNKLVMNKFCRQFYGYIDRSHNHRYQYQRKGFIENFPHIKVLRGVIVVKIEDANEIISFLESYNAEIFAREIVLVPEDLDKLSFKK